MFIGRKHGGLVLILLSVALILVGGGLGPPILGVIVGFAATRINAPLTWCTHLSDGARRWWARAINPFDAFLFILFALMAAAALPLLVAYLRGIQQGAWRKADVR